MKINTEKIHLRDLYDKSAFVSLDFLKTNAKLIQMEYTQLITAFEYKYSVTLNI